MQQRHVLEVGGAAVACTVAAAGTFQVVGGAIDWVFVLGIGMCAAIAASANYQARRTHSEQVADEAPAVAADEAPTAVDGRIATADIGSGEADPVDDQN